MDDDNKFFSQYYNLNFNILKENNKFKYYMSYTYIFEIKLNLLFNIVLYKLNKLLIIYFFKLKIH